MANYFDIAFTPTTLDLQELKGSGGLYADSTGDGTSTPHPLSAGEIDMITSRDSLYVATVSESGWPYVQHRGGEQGFVKILDQHTIGWVERTGNRQYIGTGNITANAKLAMILVDYPTRTRLKLYGEASYYSSPSADLLASLGSDVRDDGAITVVVLATNWNCPKYLTPRFTKEEVGEAVGQLQARIAELEANLGGHPH
ncbi:MAG: pyridoxamine 5'-phosphate oxidase family protein [Acidimicrobiales bacterium]